MSTYQQTCLNNVNYSNTNNYKKYLHSKNQNKKITSTELFINGKFNNHLWRSLLDKIIEELDVDKIGLEIISPFGFEVFRNNNFLRKTLRRFYCYIGVPLVNNICQQNLCNNFGEGLLKTLSDKFPDFYKNIVLKVVQQEFIKLRKDDYQCLASDVLIDIQCRETTHSILDDYQIILYVLCQLYIMVKMNLKNFLVMQDLGIELISCL